jgi:hypothetical protein
MQTHRGKSQLKMKGARTSTDPTKEITVLHKTSRVSVSPSQQLTMDTYVDPFRIIGKRLKHVEDIQNKQLFIGVRASPHSPESEHVQREENGFKYLKKGAKFNTSNEVVAAPVSKEALFEISVEFIGSSQPDLLDTY